MGSHHTTALCTQCLAPKQEVLIDRVLKKQKQGSNNEKPLGHSSSSTTSELREAMVPPKRTSTMSLLLLLCLVTTMKAGIAAPQHPRCSNAENQSSPSYITVKLDTGGSKGNSRRSVDYHTRSTSPWDVQSNEDLNRVPPVIWEAKCRYLGCVNAEGQVDSSMNSVPIQQEILVLRRETGQCNNTFRLEKMLVTVGCTCVTPIVHHVG
ncbi:interleukin-17A-like [Suncus etruscus]|uniref:interleukin-17A-like n=1 Tax=Suncus etruscus TaxID=109475 RepID=UPI00210F72CB|nr:interleukin-17A-like [Suncus etruscus]